VSIPMHHREQEGTYPMPAQRADSTQASLRITTLGPFRLERRSSLPGEPVCFTVLEGKALGDRPGMLLALLKVLLSSEQRHATKAFLADALWPEADEESALRSLRTTKNELSKVLRTPDERCLLFETPDGSGLSLAPQAEIEVDADRFEMAVEEAAQAEQTSLPHQSLLLWKHAYDLWQGTYLPGDRDRRWTEARRLELESLYSLCVQRLCFLYRTCDQSVEAERILRHYWSTHLTDEEMLSQLMELTALRGKRLTALRFYQESARALREELGVSPSEQVRMLAEQIRKRGIAQNGVLTPDQQRPYRPAANGLLLPPGTTLQSSRIAESPKDFPTSFGEWAARLLQFVVCWNGRALHCEKLQQVLNQELERWNMMINANHEAGISRRTALAALAALPLAMVPAILQGPRSSLVIEEFLPECTASITACRYLINGDGIATVALQLSGYLPALELLAQQPSRYQKTAASLASQGCLLMALVKLHSHHLRESEDCYRRAAQYSHLAKQPDLEVATLKQFATRLLEDHRANEALSLYQQAFAIISDPHNKVSPRLSGLIHLGKGAALVQLAKKQTKDADESLDMARQIFAENDPVFLPYVDLGDHHLFLWDGLSHAECGDFEGAERIFARGETLSSSRMIPERVRLEMVNRQAEIALQAGDIDLFKKYLIAGSEGAKSLGSMKRKQEVLANWKAARMRWPHEQRILELADLLI
jgi:DNA-binding SARP family transcriptional activator